MLPRKLVNFDVVIDGRRMQGVAEEITLPKLERKTEDYQGGGMLGPVALDLGMSDLKMEFTLGEFNADVLKSWGLASAAGINIRFMGALRSDDGDGKVDALEISCRGRWKTIDKGGAKRGDGSKMKVEMPLTYIKITRNGQAEIEIDLINNIEIVGGVDRAAAVRAAIGQA